MPDRRLPEVIIGIKGAVFKWRSRGIRKISIDNPQEARGDAQQAEKLRAS
jgi:hypothetical protein